MQRMFQLLKDFTLAKRIFEHNARTIERIHFLLKHALILPCKYELIAIALKHDVSLELFFSVEYKQMKADTVAELNYNY